MAIISFDTKDLQAANGGKRGLTDVITDMGVEIEEATKQEIKVNIDPNRPDLLDFTGMHRAIANFTGKKKPQDNRYKISNAPAMTITVQAAVKKVRPYIAGIVVKNADLTGQKLKYFINFTEKFSDTYGRKRKKLAIGVHSIAAINGSLTYTAEGSGSITPLGLGKPMRFDKLMKEHIKGITYQDAVPTFGKSYLYPLLKDDSKTIALIPVTNCEETKVTENTKELFIDITSTSDVALGNAAAVIACSFIDSGADVYPVEIAYGKAKKATPTLEYREIKLSMSTAERTLGVATGRHNIISLANRMGHTAAKYGSSVLFYVPPYRVDVLNEQDIIEDIAIAYGYNNIEPIAILGTSSGMSNDSADSDNRIALTMVGLGYTEAINSLLTSEEVSFTKMGWKPLKESYVSIADSKTSAITMLRQSLLPGLLQNIAASANATMPQRLFEVGKTFHVKAGKPIEGKGIAFVSVHSKANFAEIKSAVEALFKQTGTDYRIEEHRDAAFMQGRCARVVSKGRQAALFGEVHPETISNFRIEEPVVAAEISLDDL
ncbi:MAG: phenylalanine--tRNA ligase subunit beta [Candidatus Marsarchaeota archaeon]|jgi:phenylalanyl-tRNA synthetase beta chain|nr:phenylalanine--tRNA ligase subunit beta [Candidatus Marsarchaeota archaeon]MCL5111405.1 phenylalanine--tRNA ligase subunit beta [Candidatus Marsarchaeota archaeon]